MQYFQLIGLFFVDEEGKIKITNTFKLGVIAVFGLCKKFLPEHPEGYNDDQF